MQAGPPDPASWLTQTRLLPPPLRADVLPRPHLVQTLHDALRSHALTLVSAPAGYGKTTLLSALNAAASGGPVAWLSLDPEDNDPARFFTGVVAALRRVFPDCGAAALSVLAGPGRPALDPRSLAGVLVNDVLASVTTSSMLVLDDLHLITAPVIFAALDYFLERLPPQLHVAIAARHDPPLSLARLRARGQLAEFRLADLRLSAEETAQFLGRHLRPELDTEVLTLLYARTEGWPASLRLLAASLDRMPSAADRAVFLARLDQADRQTFDFLAAEVLDRQDPGTRRFLLETSILAELTPVLCRMVTGRSDAEAILEDLERRGLFVVAADEAGSAFRYHALFAEFLRRQLAQELPGRERELHRRAGRAEAAPGRAVAHLLAAADWEEAGRTIEQVAEQLVHGGLAGTVAGWIRALPDLERAKRPRLLLWQGVCAFFQGDLPSARAGLETALGSLEGSGDEGGVAEALVSLATCAYAQADFKSADTVVRRALARALAPLHHVRLLMMRSMLDVFHRPWAEALASFDAALSEAEAAGTVEVLEALTYYLRLDLAALPGALDRIERFLRWAVPLAGSSPTPLGLAIQEWVIFSHLWRGRLGQATEQCEHAMALVERLGSHPYLGLQAAGFGTAAYLAQGNTTAATRLLDIATRRLVATPFGQVYLAAALYTRGKLRLLQDDLEGARLACEELWAAARAEESTEAPALRWKLRGELDLAEGRYSAAARALQEAAALEEQRPGARLFGRAGLLLAQVAYERGRHETALAILAPVLEECERENTPGPILVDGAAAVPVLQLALRRGVHPILVEQILFILDPGGERRAVVVPATGEVLSEREAEVLRLLAAGASNRVIAERLVISQTTVKTHVHHILRKLDVSSRTQAAARARSLGLPNAPPSR